MNSDLYSEIILDHYHHPHNKGVLKKHTSSVKEYNPLCGDTIQFELLLDQKGKVKAVAFEGAGCAISQAAASLLSDKLFGKTPTQIEKIKNTDMLKLLNVEISPARTSCAMLALVTAKKSAILARHAYENCKNCEGNPKIKGCVRKKTLEFNPAGNE